MTIELPFLPPTVNTYIRHGKGRTYKTREAMKFDADVHALCCTKVMDAGLLRASVKLYFKNDRRCDLDNRLKPLFDAVAYAGVIADDSLIDEIFVKRFHADTEKTVLILEAL